MTSSTEAPILTLRRFGQHFPPQTDVATLPPGGPAVWGDRCCGLACVRTAVDHFALPVPEQAAMLADGLESGAYSARGWIHTGLLNLARRHGLDGVTGTVADLDTIAQLARAGMVVIVSCTIRFPEDGRRGGHLVTFAGTSCRDGVAMAHFCDPSRWGAEVDHVPAPRFWTSCTGNVIVLWAAHSPPAATPGLMVRTS